MRKSFKMESSFSSEKFEPSSLQNNHIYFRTIGTGTPVLLLHGFPEKHLMWRDVAKNLASKFTVICADLPGYGNSGCPFSAKNHESYSKRAMAVTMVELMAQIRIWKKWALNVQGFAVDGGHFFPEEKPEETAGFISDFIENCS